MQILITSGGTTEKIDDVRGITNFATGRLGKNIAERFLTANHKVVILAGKGAVLPSEHPHLTIISVTDVTDLAAKLEIWVPKSDVLVHSMAVSDYTPLYMTDFETVAQSDDLAQFLSLTNTQPKIASQSDYQILFLKKTPKLISLIKTLNPDIILVGFKLLVDVPSAHLISVARASLVNNQADFILANDLTEISPTRHHAWLVSSDHLLEAQTKGEIADLIVKKSEETYDQYHTRSHR